MLTETAAAKTGTSAAAGTAPLLAVRGLEAWYGESHVLHGIDFEVAPGEVVTLLGRNGAGKTTTLKSIMGVIGKRKGSVVFEARKPSRCRRAPSPGSASVSCRRSVASMPRSMSKRI